jgi:transcriptional regulator with XRE-family HTH domain
MQDNHADSLGEYVRATRKRAGLSIRQLAARADINAGYLMRVETGERSKPSPDILRRLADALQIDPAELLTFFGITPTNRLPAPRAYFRRKLGVNAEEADVLARLIEDYQATKKGGINETSNQGGNTGPH